jgi:hypothetical protein
MTSLSYSVNSTPQFRVFLVFLLMTIFLSSCAPAVAPVVTAQSPTTRPPGAPTPTLEYVIEARSWVSDPAPDREERVIVFGSLVKNRRFLGGIMMKATWIDPSRGNSQRECYLLVNYQRGDCIIEVKDFPVGIYVPVNITFNYRDRIYTTTTGFTPK